MENRVVVISGASSGIGEATARVFEDRGDVVYSFELTPPDSDASKSHSRFIQCDVGDSKQVADAMHSVTQSHGRVDVVIANAGISVRRPFTEVTSGQFEDVLRTNLLGVFNLWQSAVPKMMATGGGVLLATASTNGNVGYPYYADYNASKAGVISLCKTVALEFAGKIRTGCVSPGYVLTPMQRREYTDEMFRQTNAKIPLGRHADPAEIAEAFYFLASESAKYITGQQLVVDGGELAGGIASTFLGQS